MELMVRNSYPGLFIAIEGIDGSGLSTQTKLLAHSLKKDGFKVFPTKEPTDNVVGGLIRGTLTKSLDLPAHSLQLLFAADRGHHLQREIIPMLKTGSIVITDRYAWTSIAYETSDLGQDWLLKINQHFLKPDLTIFLKVSAKAALRRINKERFHKELYETESRMRKNIESYNSLMKKFSNSFKIVDGEKKIGQVTESALEIIRAYPKYKKLSKKVGHGKRSSKT
ncbi:MAG: dTMP kinase [Candidatus Woykebacteria bacterium RBG_13_40_7b]|uniref:Thymidylate kinase n=1 Tax=Candidatus Woykebacteria bacterium RBG_13_40_7b TaxID=1802594 RepID=A0A1G1WAW5_9BACT|nr:MAG: dTMP kinase [Candidatus Woykebacteria bacterium RBG_13_40_7b]